MVSEIVKRALRRFMPSVRSSAKGFDFKIGSVFFMKGSEIAALIKNGVITELKRGFDPKGSPPNNEIRPFVCIGRRKDEKGNAIADWAEITTEPGSAGKRLLLKSEWRRGGNADEAWKKPTSEQYIHSACFRGKDSDFNTDKVIALSEYSQESEHKTVTNEGVLAARDYIAGLLVKGENLLPMPESL